jgi:hypothetical protein
MHLLAQWAEHRLGVLVPVGLGLDALELRLQLLQFEMGVVLLGPREPQFVEDVGDAGRVVGPPRAAAGR